jgi:hypothetical protein
MQHPTRCCFRPERIVRIEGKSLCANTRTHMEAREALCRYDSISEEVKHVRLGCGFSDHRTCGSGPWVWRYRRCFSGHRETAVFYIPCAVRNLVAFWVAWQTRALSCACEHQDSWEFASLKRQRGRCDAVGEFREPMERLTQYAVCAFCS